MCIRDRYANGLISLQQFCAKEGIGTSAALNEGIVTFKKDSSRYTIAEAVAKMKPRRVVIMLGTNDTGMAVEDFISNYKQLVQAIQTSYPYTDITVSYTHLRCAIMEKRTLSGIFVLEL